MTDPPGTGQLSILLPATWKVMDLDPRTRNQSIDRLVRQAVGGGDQRARLRRWASLAYRRAVADASEAGAFFVANYAEEVEGHLLGATLVAFMGLSPRDGGGSPLGPDEMVAQLDDVAQGEELIDPARVVDLGVGPAVRSRVRVASVVPDSGGRELPVDVTRFFVPVPDSEKLMVLAFSTPLLAVADALSGLFDQVARGLRWRP